MKYIVVFLVVFACKLSSAQDPMSLIERVWKQQKQITSISYKLTRNDILVTGNKRQIKGEAYYNLSDKGLEFDIKRLDVQHELFQTAGTLLFVDHSGRQYSVKQKLSFPDSIQYQPAGQVFVEDLFHLDTSNAIAYELKDSSNYKVIIIRRSDIDEYDVRQRYKEIVVDPKINLPVKVRLHQETAGKVQDLNYTLSDIKVNDAETLAIIRNSSVPAGYAQFDIAPQTQEELAPGTIAPAFRLNDTTGSTVTLETFKGQLVLLDFWEVWCGPCLASMPKIDEIYLKYKGRGLTVLGVLLRGEQWEQARKMKRVTQNHYSQLLGNQQVGSDYKVYAIPHYVLIDRNGKIISSAIGDPDSIENAIKAAL